MTTAVDLRRENTALVLRTLRFEGPTTRSRLAERTGLAKATIGTIVSELGSRDVLLEGGPEATDRGRPGRPVALSGQNYLGLGLEANVDYVAAVAVELSGQRRFELTVPVAPGDSPQAALEALLTDALGRLDPGDTLVGVRCAVPGLVDQVTGRVVLAPNLGWTDLDLASALRPSLGNARVEIENDANCATLAEQLHGAAVGVDHAMYLTGTVGIGAGIIVDGRLLRGGAGFAGEVGHIPAGRAGVRCGCGRLGCWETAVGLRGILDVLGLVDDDTPQVLASRIAARQDPEANTAIEKLGADVAHGLSMILPILDSDVVVLGGYFAALGDRLVRSIEASLRAQHSSSVRQPELRLSTLGLGAAALGAAEHALSGVFDGTTPL